jgi:glycerate kinase
MNVIIAMDSFKGCASSLELSCAITQGIRTVYQDATIKAYEIADGGEGTLQAMVHNTGGELITCKVHDPLMHLIEAQYGILGDGVTAVIEMAQASGLPLVPVDKRNPLYTTTFGVGELIAHALERGCREFIVGIGGSATNDGGVGMLQALGYRFLDKEGNNIAYGGGALGNIVHIETEHAHPALKKSTFTIACDVDNPMYGERGAAYIYGPQKGATPETVILLDANIKHFANCIKEHLGRDVAHIPGSGAAGALGGGFLGFFTASLRSGIDIVLDSIQFDTALKTADIVITGEGKVDAQSLMGKVISGIAKRCTQANVPLIVLAGQVDKSALRSHEHGVSALFSIMHAPMSLEEAMDKETALGLVKQKSEELFRLINAIS